MSGVVIAACIATCITLANSNGPHADV
jgi:hypothetical protein